MRSVFVHLRNANSKDVERWLQESYHNPHSDKMLCVVEVDGDSYLYVDFFDMSEDPQTQDDPSWWTAVLKTFRQKPTVGLVVDISGRHPGDKELRDFLGNLLAKFEGVLQDEYTSHCWTLEEIQASQQVKNHPFFDYRGWYEQRRDLEKDQAHGNEQESI